MVGTNSRSDGELELLSFGQAFPGKVARVEAELLTDQLTLVLFRRGVLQEERGEAYGVVMMTSASTSSLSKVEFSPSLSDVVTRV